MSQPISDNFKLNANKHLDDRYGPYTSIDAATNAIPIAYRVPGLTIGIIINDEVVEYWWKNRLTNSGLAPKVIVPTPPPPTPEGVEWSVKPNVPTIGPNEITETYSEVLVDGEYIWVYPATLDILPAATGKKRKDAIVARYEPTDVDGYGHYEVVTGEEVDDTSILSPTPSIPDGTLFVRYIDVNEEYIVPAPVEGALTNPIWLSHNAAKLLASNGLVVPEQRYILTDYKTIHTIPNTSLLNTTVDPTIPFENLVLIGANASSYQGIVHSLQFPSDIIRYNINDSTGGRPGFITYRKDTLLDNEVEGFDFRESIFMRKKPNAPSFDPAKNDYNYGSVVKHTDNFLYIYRHFISGKVVSITDTSVWAKMCNVTTTYLSTTSPINGASGAVSVPSLDATEYYFRVFTPNGTQASTGNSSRYYNWAGRNNKIISTFSGGVGINVVFIAANNGAAILDNVIGNNSDNNTIISSTFYNNIIGSYSYGNLFIGSMSKNTLPGSTRGNYYGNGFVQNSFFGGSGTTNIGNKYLDNFADNQVHGDLGYSIFQGATKGNDIESFNGNISLGTGNYDNEIRGFVIGSGITGNSFYAADGFSRNVLAGNTVASYFGSSYIDNKHFGKTISSYFAASNTGNRYLRDITTSGSQTIPLKVSNTILNQNWNSVTMLDTSIAINKCIFNEEQNSTIFTTSITGQIIPASTGGGSGGSSGPSKVEFIFPEVSIDSFDEIYLDKAVVIASTTKTDNIASITYYVKEDSGTYISKATYTDVNDWITTNITAGDRYWIKAVQTRTTGALNKGYHTLTLS